MKLTKIRMTALKFFQITPKSSLVHSPLSIKRRSEDLPSPATIAHSSYQDIKGSKQWSHTALQRTSHQTLATYLLIPLILQSSLIYRNLDIGKALVLSRFFHRWDFHYDLLIFYFWNFHTQLLSITIYTLIYTEHFLSSSSSSTHFIFEYP